MDPIYSYGTKFDIWIILFLFNLTHTQTHTDIHTYTYTHIHTYKPRTIIHIHINAMPLHARKNCTLFSLSPPISISIALRYCTVTVVQNSSITND